VFRSDTKNNDYELEKSKNIETNEDGPRNPSQEVRLSTSNVARLRLTPPQLYNPDLFPAFLLPGAEPPVLASPGALLPSLRLSCPPSKIFTFTLAWLGHHWDSTATVPLQAWQVAI
jgi:hypothetical protein